MKEKKEPVNSKAKWMSIVLLVIMLASVVGFAFTFSSGSSTQSSSGDNGLPPEVPLQQIEQQGQLLWFTVRNSELFVFETVDPLIEDRVAAELAQKIEVNNEVNIYVDSSFESLDSVFLIERALVGERIEINRVPALQCDSSTLILAGPIDLAPECLVLVDDKNSTYQRAEALVYHIVKD